MATKKTSTPAKTKKYTDAELRKYRAKSNRVHFGKINEAFDFSNLLAVQCESFDWLLGNDAWKKRLEESKKNGKNDVADKSGLDEVFESVSPIENRSGTMSLYLTEPKFEEPSYTEKECKEKNLTYSAALYVNAEFVNNETGEIRAQTVFMGNYPMMTEKGSFIINGVERVIVSQITRSPGVYFEKTLSRAVGEEFFTAKIIPSRGAWLEFEYDKKDTLGIRIDRRRRQLVTGFLKALGITDEEIKKEFKEFPEIFDMLEKDGVKNRDEALLDLYKKARPKDPMSVEAGEKLLYDFFFNPKKYSLKEVGRSKINSKIGVDVPLDTTILTKEDIVQLLKYICSLHAGKKTIKGVKDGKRIDVPLFLDDIDHFSNRRIRTVAELVANQIRAGLVRLNRVVAEKMDTQNPETITPQSLLNISPLIASIREFFNSSQLSQFMDQNNPLSALSHKRRLSALGPGGLSRDRAGMKVRDVHSSHYGRMCPIESPEGANIGLIGSLATYAVINRYGFIETPYRKVVKGKVTDQIDYLSAAEESNYIIAQANQKLNKDGSFVNEWILVRDKDDNVADVKAEEVDYIDVSPKQLVSVGTSLIPFLEHDDTNRALMGANMQRQAVPLINCQAPLVGTGSEWSAAVDGKNVVVANKPGVITEIDAEHAIVKNDDGTTSEYDFDVFVRSNQTTCYTSTVRANEGDKVIKGSVLADGSATVNGELSLGTNLLVAFMSWEGYNFEDAIILSQRVVQDDSLTSIHIEEYEIDARDTKLGPEEITRDIPNVSEQDLSRLDENGIIAIGSDVVAGDILVGKTTPKGEVELTAEERLLRAIFGEKSKEVRDNSLRVPHGESGTVVGFNILKGDEEEDLPTGVNTSIKVYVASCRKIAEGDKLSGRHGNKGVISRILPVEDMPFMEDGTPIDIILNPLGVPSRMNLGQVLEVHLGWLAKQGWNVKFANCPVDDNGFLNENKLRPKSDQLDDSWLEDVPERARVLEPNTPVATPVFDGVSNRAIRGLMRSQLPNEDGRRLVDDEGKAYLFDGRTGEKFSQKFSVGYMYILKLHHLVDEKIHARSTGPYSMITQQPLGGKAQFGGQRFGEMEVWALEAYGASHLLQEIMTYKSDDIKGRSAVFEAIVRGDNIPKPGVPESFKVLLKEMQSLGLNISIHDNKDRLLSYVDSFDLNMQNENSSTQLTEEIDESSAVNLEDIESYVSNDVETAESQILESILDSSEEAEEKSANQPEDKDDKKTKKESKEK